MKKRLFFSFFLIVCFLLPSFGHAGQQEEGEPLLLPQKDYPSDLAPETDPDWETEKKHYKKTGENPYEIPVESYYEQKTTYKKVKPTRKRGNKYQR